MLESNAITNRSVIKRILNRLWGREDVPVSDERHELGESGESFAVRLLKEGGYKIIEQNYRCRLGEIDIIAEENGVLTFVEVKARRADRFEAPKSAVTPKKKRKISMVALHYLKETQQMDKKARFDVVAIRSFPEHPDAQIIKNAFDLAY
jgi:putative endonuclease